MSVLTIGDLVALLLLDCPCLRSECESCTAVRALAEGRS